MSGAAVLAKTRTPVVVVLGTTGAGKSKLAIEIAQRFGGEVISADAVQMYKVHSGLHLNLAGISTRKFRLCSIFHIDPYGFQACDHVAEKMGGDKEWGHFLDYTTPVYIGRGSFLAQSHPCSPRKHYF